MSKPGDDHGWSVPAGRAFSGEEVFALEAALSGGQTLLCPSCRVTLDERPVAPPTGVSYVRRRLVLTCPRCHGHAAVDRPRTP